MSLTRRRFLGESLLAAAAAVVARSPAAAGGAPAVKSRDALRVAVIGVRGQGRAHVAAYRDLPDADVVAVCDPDESVIGPAMKAVPEAKYVKDIRKLLEDETIDAVSIAAPNHWHALAAVWALQAGKHVYVEKPISHGLAEGRAVIAAAAKYGRVVQHGTQARSHAACREALEWLRGGGLGVVSLATGLCYKPRESLGKCGGEQAPPATLDYDLWIGPAEMRPLRRKSLHYDWHWDFNTGNGDIGNQGVHQMDLARWGLGLDSFPRRAISLGGRLGYEDDGETPNTQICFYDWGEKQIIFEVRGLNTAPFRGANIGTIFHGEGGWLVIQDYAKAVAFDAQGAPMRTFEGGGDHFAGFVNAVQGGGGNAAGARDGHLSSGLCHLGNISWRLGSARPLAALGRPFGDHAAGADALARFREHLLANGVAADAPIRLGPALDFDSVAEKFTGDRAGAAQALAALRGRGAFAFPKDL